MFLHKAHPVKPYRSKKLGDRWPRDFDDGVWLCAEALGSALKPPGFLTSTFVFNTAEEGKPFF
jgi:hypothetical protein